MTNRKTTRRALVLSLLSLLLCCSMLVGTTFAWFTDSVQTGNNKIIAGNLDVEMYHSDKAVTNEKVTATTKLFDDIELWEPGVVAWENLTVSNEGTLGLKYELSVNFTKATKTPAGKTLADVLKVAFVEGGVDGTLTREKMVADITTWGKLESFAQNGELKAGTTAPTTDTYGIVIYWEPGANDNEFNMNNGNKGVELSIDLGVTLVATQLEAEGDSFGTNYDKDAVYADVTVTNAADLEAAIAAGKKTIGIQGVITLTKSLGATGVTFVGTTGKDTIDFMTYGISGIGNTFVGLTLDNDRNGYYNGMQYSDAENTTYKNCVIANGVTTYGNSTFKGCTFNELPAGNYALWFYDGVNFVVEDCVFNYGNRAIKIFADGSLDMKVTIRNCSFKASETSVANKAMIEIDDVHMRSVNVTVSDITIDSAIAAQGVYRIDDGELNTSTAKSVVSVDGVVTSAKVASQTELADALATDGEVAVELAAGTYKLPNISSDDITITGTGDDTVIDFTGAANVNGASITFEGVKFQGRNENVMNGFGIQSTTGDIVYKGCTFDGAVTNEYYGTVTYIGCEFTGTGYITTYAVKSATFEGCVFDKADSRAVLVYSHGNNPCVVTIDGCQFKAAAKATTWAGDWTAAIEVDTTNIPTQGTSVTVNGCTYDANYSGLVRDKSAEGKANAVITIDGILQ